MADTPDKPDLAGLSAARLTDRVSAGMSSGVGGAEVIAFGLSVLWIVLSAGLILFLPSGASGGFDGLRFVLGLVVIVLPVAGIWAAVTLLNAARLMRQDALRLQAALDTLRQAVLSDRSARAAGPGIGPALGLGERKMTDVVRTGEPAPTARPPADRPAAAKPQPARTSDDQPRLALGTPAEDTGPPLTRSDMIRALNFPDTDKDEAGFAALRRALTDRQARQLIQASQDVLTLLSQDGIYMDDLRPDRAKPEIWRRFASGERGRAVAALGGIRDRSCLALAIGRMREDTIFRDAAHHFLRLFDRMLVEFEPEGTDEEIADLSETRTARAFMLLGRVTGAFD